MKQKIIFTALPNGINQTNGNLKLSVAISLQVTETSPTTTLAVVDDMRNWPDIINKARFTAQVNGALVEATITSVLPVLKMDLTKPLEKTTPQVADKDLWSQLFTPLVKVNAFVQPNKTNIPILSYPVKHVEAYIKKIAEATGKIFTTDMPKASDYTNNPFVTAVSNYEVVPYPKPGQREKPQLKDLVIKTNRNRPLQILYKQSPFIPFKADDNPSLTFAQACNFHGLYSLKEKDAFVQFDRPNFEFHDILSVLTQYPKLMRRLGLVIDLEIPNKSILASSKTEPAIRVFPSGLNLTTPTTITCPATAYETTKIGFYAKPENSSSFHDKGHVKINDEKAFTVFQVDTDGAVLKFVSHVDALQLKRAKNMYYAIKNDMPSEAAIPIFNNEEEPRREGLPTHRTAGIAIAKNGMAEYLHGRFVRMQDMIGAFAGSDTPPAGITNTNAKYSFGNKNLYADDVTIGYRLAVKKNVEKGKEDWRSLHLHNNDYSITKSATENIPIPNIGVDEGFIQLSTSEDTNRGEPHMKLSEVIARWEGWSLAVPMPGISINEPTLTKAEAEKTDADEKLKYKTPPNVPFKLNVYPKAVSGTLPKLRFGQGYSLKLRMVDMAGNSAPLNGDGFPENTKDCVASVDRYRRYEPVDAPFLVPGNIFENDKLSDPDHHNFIDGESAEVMVIRSNEGQSVADYEKDPKHIYHAQPAANGQPPVKAQPGPFKADCTRHVKPPRTTIGMAITHGMVEKAVSEGGTVSTVYQQITLNKDPKDTSKPGIDIIPFDSNTLAQVAKSSDAAVPVEYLVDPMAAGVSFFLLALDPNIKFKASDANIFSKRVSFYFDPEVLADADANKEISYSNWMSPKTFRIVLKESENFGCTWSKDASRILTVTLPRGFMLKVNYACFWRPQDVPIISGVLNMMGMNNLNDAVGQAIAKGQHWMFSPWRTLTLVHATQQPVTKNLITPAKPFPFIDAATTTRDFGETVAHLNIDMGVHGASTGVVDIEADWTDKVDDTNDLITKGPRDVTQRAKVFHFTALYKVYQYVFGDFPDKKIMNNPFNITHKFNDTRHRWINYTVIASTRYKENFYNLLNQEKDVDDDKKVNPITRKSKPFTKVKVLSSARPLAPQVAYVIPTFEWAEETKGDTITRGRGSGLRIYLKRPWYTSGEGEKLAVVLLLSSGPKSLMQLNSKLADQLCTTWGNDPTKQSPGAGGIFPGSAAFIGVKKGDANNLYAKDNLSIAELEGAAVNMVAYDVQYDTERQLHYADIMLNFGVSYFPFIRLALAAYQQHSVVKDGVDLCLSKIVQADYIQIPPPRFTSLTRSGSKVTIAISGTLPAIRQSNYRPKVEFIIEHIEFDQKENAVISINPRPINIHSHIIDDSELTNFTFTHSDPFDFDKNPIKTYRVKIFEYEVLTPDPRRFGPSLVGGGSSVVKAVEERVVFADVYEVKG